MSEAVITELRDRVEQLEEEVAYWKGEAGALADEDVRVTLRQQLKLTPTQSYLFALLYARRGKTVNRLLLDQVMPLEDRARERIGNTVDAQVSKIRNVIGTEMIGTEWGVGYFLTDACVSACDKILLSLQNRISTIRTKIEQTTRG